MKYTAIVIDDEIWTRDVVKGLGKWDELGIEIIAEASDGEYGLELITCLNPNIIITDVKMPCMSGLDLVRTLRESGNRAKVIFVSGFDEFTYIHNAIKLEASDYLLKPIKRDELNNRLKRCVDELNAQQKIEPQQVLDLQGFMNVAWIEGYKKWRNAIAFSLHSDDTAVLYDNFQKLMAFIGKQDNHSVTKSTIICIYFDFHQCLQNYIDERGYSLEQIFDNKPLSFVFSNVVSTLEMFQYIQNLFMQAQKKIIQLTKSKNRINVAQVKQYADCNFLNGITLEETALRFYVSKEYLSKIFKQEIGISFSDYVTQLKMEKAKELLLTHKVPIKEVAELIGYADQAHFYKVFKKYFNITPGSMMDQIKF